MYSSVASAVDENVDVDEFVVVDELVVGGVNALATVVALVKSITSTTKFTASRDVWSIRLRRPESSTTSSYDVIVIAFASVPRYRATPSLKLSCSCCPNAAALYPESSSAAFTDACDGGGGDGGGGAGGGGVGHA